MIKLNWKSRIKNLNFWIGLTGATALFIQTVLKLLDLPLDPGPVQELLNAFFSLLAAYGVLIDPSTPGISDHSMDSEQYPSKVESKISLDSSNRPSDIETVKKILRGGNL